MAKSKDGYVSKGERRNVRRDICNAERRAYREHPINLIMNKQAAWKKMKKVYLTIPNPNTNETNKRFLRVEAKDIWGDPRRVFIMGSKQEESQTIALEPIVAHHASLSDLEQLF